ncbi:GCN5 family N-acetyltransferase [Siccirubricoccus deserti]|uniref:GNAT family N-acetyltransferase n=1 Tax=Siccirubricoccus deserti TaxID=2013562 RepID=A0A9X0QZI5_9PROT|nr:GNAT family N-acetyltransferase [Siccirubricoccus deserti]MBC4015922.1 GNAT family N-acetyltransferase [Siccirubricoccus deserti]GGC39194.1 GCN5 family N-acetyltransferase [Siccirubricoccus deserti]
MIRRAVPDDAPALAAMLRALNDEPGLQPGLITPDRVARDLIGDARCVVLVACLDGHAAGLATAHPSYDSGHSRWGLFLNDLYVVPEARRHGMGRALVAAMAAEALASGGSFLWWNADEGDETALAFHRRLGAETALVTDFILAGESLARMARSA